MLTVQMFKTRQSLSDSQFKRIRALAEKNTGSTVTERMGSSTWAVTDELALMTALAEYDNGSLMHPLKPVENCEAEIVTIDPFAISPYTPRVSALNNAFSSLKPLEVDPTYEIDDQSDEIKNQLIAMLGFLNSQAENSDSLIAAQLKQAKQQGQQLALAKFQAQKQAETETLRKLQQLDAMNTGLVKKSQEEMPLSVS